MNKENKKKYVVRWWEPGGATEFEYLGDMLNHYAEQGYEIDKMFSFWIKDRHDTEYSCYEIIFKLI